MLKCTRSGILGLVLAIGCPMLLAPAILSAQPQHQSVLQLHRWHYRLDDSGQAWLLVSIANGGAKPVTIRGMSLAQKGPWTAVNQKVDAYGTFKGTMKIAAGRPPAELWIDSSEGLEKFALPAR